MEFDDSYCSDDDIFLSPDKRNKRTNERAQDNLISVEGIYEMRVKRLKSCLTGLPRPPVKPINVYFSMEDIELFVKSALLDKKPKGDEEVVERGQGDNKTFGIYLNLDHSCEEFEKIGALYIEKYLPYETLSTMSDQTSYAKLTASAKKRRRCNGWGSSPGSRLSYLARRKTTFSVDHVSKLMQPSNSKQFLLQRDQSVRALIKSTPLKPKRALFQSPEEEKVHNPFRTPELDRRRRVIRRLSVPNQLLRSEQEKPVKEDRKKRNCKKSLEFNNFEEKIDKRERIESSDKHVKRKLLWAVSTALKSVSVTSTHTKFKMCMNKLFKATLTKWNEKLGEKSCQQENTFSTSEAMLDVAKSLLDTVINPELIESRTSQVINDTNATLGLGNLILANDQSIVNGNDIPKEQTQKEVIDFNKDNISPPSLMEVNSNIATLSSESTCQKRSSDRITSFSLHRESDVRKTLISDSEGDELGPCGYKRKRARLEEEKDLDIIESVQGVSSQGTYKSTNAKRQRR